MARPDSTLTDILTAFLARLKAAVTDATDATAYISDDPDYVAPSPGEFVYVVSPMPIENYPEESQVGGGENFLESQTLFLVTIHSTQQQKDEPGRAQEFFINANTGLFPRKRDVLKAFVNHDLLHPSSGEPMLRHFITARDSNWDRQQRPKGSVQIGFNIVYDMDLS